MLSAACSARSLRARQYEPRRLANQSEGARAAFRSTSLRLENPSEEAAPGPGDYHDGLVRPVGYIPEHLQSLDMRMPTFKERSAPRITRVHRDLPAASAKARGVLGNFANEVSRQCLGSQALAVALPGPGEYQDITKAQSSAATAGSAFQGSKRDLGAQESSFPGPGKYEPRKVASPMARTLRSAFQSTSDRGKIEALTFDCPAILQLYRGAHALEMKQSP
ncbi:stpg1 [Symbiodinium sp. CCMP2456]|nr:stpg1 [Symbiodinium sp. CCMP2456]